MLDGGVLSLSKIGRMRVRLHRPLEGTPKTVTISKEADGWYACISCAEVPVEPLPRTGRETGIDVGLTVFLITADREVVENPRHYRTAEKHLAKAQRRVGRRKQGSKRRRKAMHLLRRKHQHVQRQRRDFHHKAALYLPYGARGPLPSGRGVHGPLSPLPCRVRTPVRAELSVRPLSRGRSARPTVPSGRAGPSGATVASCGERRLRSPRL